jgi:hypothetical protein
VGMETHCHKFAFLSAFEVLTDDLQRRVSSASVYDPQSRAN